MSQTILIEPDEKLKKLYSLNLNAYAGTDVIDRANGEDAIALLNILPDISLIICRCRVGDESSALDIHNFLKDKSLDIPVIALGECEELAGKVLTLKDPVGWENVVEKAAQILGVEEKEIQKKVQASYTPVGIRYFYEIGHTPCDVYIRIQKSDSSYQFVKRLHAQDSFTAEDIKKYQEQGLTHFFLPKDFQQYFVNFVTNTIIQEMEQADLDLGARLATNSNAYDIVKERVAEAGLDDAVNQLAESCIDSMIKSIEASPTLSTLLKKLFNNKISYAYQHAHLVCVIGDFILSKQKWYEKKHLELFTIVSFFSDITLNTPEQIRINTMADLKESGLSDERKQAVLGHAKDASEIMVEYPDSTPTIQEIIMQHHGQFDGHGFAQNPSEELNPIARVFMVADAFVKIMLDPEMPKNKKEILSILYAQYSAPSFEKIIKSLEQKIN